MRYESILEGGGQSCMPELFPFHFSFLTTFVPPLLHMLLRSELKHLPGLSEGLESKWK